MHARKAQIQENLVELMANSPMSSSNASASASASAATDGQPPCKKKKQSKEPIPNSSLPYDLVVSCLARVPRLYYPNLSLLSKSFRSILTSPELYRFRNVLGRTETFLYVCLQFPDEANPRWFILYQKPNQTLTNHTSKKKKKNDSSCNLLAPVAILNPPPVEWSGFIAVDYNIYGINAAIEDSPCSNVWLLDCRSHTWLEAPRMRLAHTNGGFEGKMYLPGSSEKPDSMNCVEMYNTKTQTWKPVPPEKRIFKLRNLEGKIHLMFDPVPPWIGVAFEPKHMTGELVGLGGRCPACLIENRTYHYNGQFIWKELDINISVWRNLEGLEGLPKFANYSTVKLANCGGKLMVLWDKYVRASGYKEKMIWCAEISLEMRNAEEIWGRVEWCDEVLKVPKSYKFLCAIAANL